MTIPELENSLRSAQERQRRAINALAPKHRGGEVEEFRAAQDALLEAERDLAAAKGEQYAVPIDFPVAWDVGAPLPHLLQNDYRTFLVFFLRDVDPNWNGIPKIIYPDSAEVRRLAVVEIRSVCTKFGDPNDEVFHGHPLHGKGFESYRALAVENSNWLKELEAINSVHRGYKPEFWRELKHYVLPCHDSTFECIARSLSVETRETSLPQLLTEICQRLVE